MPTRNVVLTDHQASTVERLVETDRYQNASEVLRDGLRLIESREAEDAAKLEALREAARIGDEAFERGDYKTFASTDELIAHLTEKTEDVVTGPDLSRRRCGYDPNPPHSL